MKYVTTALLGVLCLAFSLTAPFVAPIALIFTARDAKSLPPIFFLWDTPDEPDLYDLDIPAVRAVYERWGWFVTAWYWFGIRNRGHGFDSLFAREAPAYWPEGEGSHERDGYFIDNKRFGDFLLVFGWQVYASHKYMSGLEYRPKLAVKGRPL